MQNSTWNFLQSWRWGFVGAISSDSITCIPIMFDFDEIEDSGFGGKWIAMGFCEMGHWKMPQETAEREGGWREEAEPTSPSQVRKLQFWVGARREHCQTSKAIFCWPLFPWKSPDLAHFSHERCPTRMLKVWVEKNPLSWRKNRELPWFFGCMVWWCLFLGGKAWTVCLWFKNKDPEKSVQIQRQRWRASFFSWFCGTKHKKSRQTTSLARKQIFARGVLLRTGMLWEMKRSYAKTLEGTVRISSSFTHRLEPPWWNLCRSWQVGVVESHGCIDMCIYIYTHSIYIYIYFPMNQTWCMFSLKDTRWHWFICSNPSLSWWRPPLSGLLGLVGSQGAGGGTACGACVYPTKICTRHSWSKWECATYHLITFFFGYPPQN